MSPLNELVSYTTLPLSGLHLDELHFKFTVFKPNSWCLNITLTNLFFLHSSFLTIFHSYIFSSSLSPASKHSGFLYYSVFTEPSLFALATTIAHLVFPKVTLATNTQHPPYIDNNLQVTQLPFGQVILSQPISKLQHLEWRPITIKIKSKCKLQTWMPLHCIKIPHTPHLNGLSCLLKMPSSSLPEMLSFLFIGGFTCSFMGLKVTFPNSHSNGALFLSFYYNVIINSTCIMISNCFLSFFSFLFSFLSDTSQNFKLHEQGKRSLILSFIFCI